MAYTTPTLAEETSVPTTLDQDWRDQRFFFVS